MVLIVNISCLETIQNIHLIKEIVRISSWLPTLIIFIIPTESII